MPAPSDVTERFAVGVIPYHRVEGFAEGAKCYDTFTPGDVLERDGEVVKAAREGTFKGGCGGSSRTFQAVTPAKTAIDVSGGGTGQPLVLAMNAPSEYGTVTVRVVDRCGMNLSLGATRGITTWTAGPGCEQVAKVVPYDLQGATEKDESMQIVPVGTGTCTITASLLGVSGELAVTVR